MCKAPFTWFQLAPLFCSAILVGVQWLVGKHFHHPAVQRRINRLNFWFSHVGNPFCRGMCKAPFTWFQLAPLFCSAILVGVQWLVGKHFHHPAVQRRINRLNFWFSHVGNPFCRGMCKAPFTWFQLAPLFCSAILVGVQWLVGKHFHHPAVQRRINRLNFWFSHVGNPFCRGMCKAPCTWFQLAPLFCSAILVGVQWLVGKHFQHPAVQRRINRLNFWFSHVGNPFCRRMCKAPFTWFQLAPLFCSAILVGVQWLVGKHFHHPAVQRRINRLNFWFSHVGNPFCRGMCKAPFTWFQLAPLFCSAILVGVQWLVGKHFHHPAVQRRINRLNFWFSHVGNPFCRGMCKAPFTWFQLAPFLFGNPCWCPMACGQAFPSPSCSKKNQPFKLLVFPCWQPVVQGHV